MARFARLVLRLSLILVGLAALGCARTTTSVLAPDSGRAKYEIECIRLGECWQAAERACRGAYYTVEQHENTIPESDLPGLNARTQLNAAGHDGYTYGEPAVPVFGPGIESTEPLSLAQVVVVCGGS